MSLVICVCMSANLRSYISETEEDRGSLATFGWREIMGGNNTTGKKVKVKVLYAVNGDTP